MAIALVQAGSGSPPAFTGGRKTGNVEWYMTNHSPRLLQFRLANKR
jgi:hypothetical protein